MILYLKPKKLIQLFCEIWTLIATYKNNSLVINNLMNEKLAKLFTVSREICQGFSYNLQKNIVNYYILLYYCT